MTDDPRALKDENDERLVALRLRMSTRAYNYLPIKERQLLQRQEVLMSHLSLVLSARIVLRCTP